jgi:hypothetical protein
MASTDFHVNGPTVVRWKIAGAQGTATALGYTDNDDLIRISTIDHRRNYTRNDGGDMIAESVLSGTTATLDMTLVSWDETELNELISYCRTGTAGSAIGDQGKIATVGGPTVTGNVRCVALEIFPANTGADAYLFNRMILTTGPEYMDLGNAVKRISMSFTSAFVAGDTVFATISNAT